MHNELFSDGYETKPSFARVTVPIFIGVAFAGSVIGWLLLCAADLA